MPSNENAHARGLVKSVTAGNARSKTRLATPRRPCILERPKTVPSAHRALPWLSSEVLPSQVRSYFSSARKRPLLGSKACHKKLKYREARSKAVSGTSRDDCSNITAKI